MLSRGYVCVFKSRQPLKESGLRFDILKNVALVIVEYGFKFPLLSTVKEQLSYRFNLSYRYIDDVLSINKPIIRKLCGPDVSC